jgi:hypothetical protein
MGSSASQRAVGAYMAVPSAARGLDGQPQAGTKGSSGRRVCSAYSQEAKAGTARGRLGEASPGRASPPGVGHGLPVRRHRRACVHLFFHLLLLLEV